MNRMKRNYMLLGEDDFVTINVCGMIYETLKDTLERFPDTLLGDEESRDEHFVDFKNAYYFDRHRECFEAILYYYQSGGCLIRPAPIPMDIFINEVKFFRIPDEALKQLKQMEGYTGPDEEEEEEPPENKYQELVWKTMEYPESSTFARVIAFLSVLIILISIITFCIESLPQFHASDMHARNCTNGTINANRTINNRINNNTINSNNTNCPDEQPSDDGFDVKKAKEVLGYIEIVSITWFTAEYLIRLLSSPKKWKFFKSLLNLIDLAAILPYYIILIIESGSEHRSSLAVIRVARLVRVFRVFKLSRHSLGLQIFGSTLKASLNELWMLGFILCFCVLIFSSAMYYAEHDDEKTDESSFKSIPDAFWYSVVTMTTVGYGDIAPKTYQGKIIGSICAISGVLTVAMVVPVIVTNFEFFYKRDRIHNLNQQRAKDGHRGSTQSGQDMPLLPQNELNNELKLINSAPNCNST